MYQVKRSCPHLSGDIVNLLPPFIAKLLSLDYGVTFVVMGVVVIPSKSIRKLTNYVIMEKYE